MFVTHRQTACLTAHPRENGDVEPFITLRKRSGGDASMYAGFANARSDGLKATLAQRIHSQRLYALAQRGWK